MASLNTAVLTADLDRSPAVKGQVRPDKLIIEFGQPDDKMYRRWCFPQHNKGENFDWQNMEHIRSLNKWRNQIFRYVGRLLQMRAIQKLTTTRRRTFGSSKPGPVPFHKEEVDWLTELFVLHQKTALEQGMEPDYHTMNWNIIAKSFNDHFEGKMLPNCDGPRPHRTKTSIQTQKYRIEAICKLTGVTLKGEAAKLKKLAEAGSRGEVPKVKTRPRKGTTGIDRDGSRTVEKITPADTTNDGTKNDSNTVVTRNAIPDEEEESSDGAGISEEENA